jgi:hypothetical protein
MREGTTAPFLVKKSIFSNSIEIFRMFDTTVMLIFTIFARLSGANALAYSAAAGASVR